MDIITTSYLDEFKGNFDFKSIKDEEYFEYFINYCIVSKHHTTETITKDTLEDIHIGGGNDTGIDGFIVLANGKIVSTIQEIKDLLGSNGYLKIKFIAIQTKTSPSFETNEIAQFLDGVKLMFRRLYDEDITIPTVNEEIQHYYDLVEFIYKNSSKFENGDKPSLSLYYVTTGKYDNTNTDIKSKFENAIREINSYDLLSKGIEYNPLGHLEIQKYYADTKQHEQASITVSQSIPLPDIDNVNQGYLFLLPFSEYRKLIIDEQTDSIKNVFNDNIRAYQGDNPVNREIGNTIEQGQFNLFTAMNNGITIIAKKMDVTGRHITLNDYQIVNGCQTSHVLFQKRNVPGINNVNLLVKLISSSDREVRNHIILGANSQTAVMREQLIALSELQERIERYYGAVKDTEKLYYERRSKQYKGDSNVPTYKVITIPIQIMAIVSMFLSEPYNVSGYYGSIVEKLENGTQKIFSDDYQLDIYYTSGFAYYKMCHLFDRGIIGKDFKKIKFQLLLAFRLVCEKEVGSMPNLNNKKMPSYCEKINKILDDPQKCKEMFSQACELVQKVVGHTIKDGDNREEVTKRLIKEVKYVAKSDSTSNIQEKATPVEFRTETPTIHPPRVIGKIDLSNLPRKKFK